MMKKYFNPADFLISRSGSPDPAVESNNELGFDKTVFIILNMPIVSVSAINPCKDAKTGADLNVFESAWNHCKFYLSGFLWEIVLKNWINTIFFLNIFR